MKFASSLNGSDSNVPVDSRKRKAHILEAECENTQIFGSTSQPVRGNQELSSVHFLPRSSNIQHIAGRFFGAHVKGSTPGMLLNSSFQFTESVGGSQYGKGQFYGLDTYPIRSQTEGGNFQRAAVDSITDHGSKKLSSFLNNESFSSPLLSSSVPENQVLPSFQGQGHELPLQNESKRLHLLIVQKNRLHSFSSVHAASIEKDHSTIDVACGSISAKGSAPASNLSQKMFNSSSDASESSEVLQKSVVKNQNFGHHRNNDERHCSQSSYQNHSVEFDQNGQNLGVTGSIEIPNAGIKCSQNSASNDPRAEMRLGISQVTVSGSNVCSRAVEQNSKLEYQRLMREKSSCDELCSESKKVDSEVKFSANTETITTKKPDESRIKYVKHHVMETVPDTTNNDAKTLKHGDNSSLSINLDGISVVHSRKVAPKKSQKLWDGLLQLNASTTVSAVAFFKRD